MKRNKREENFRLRKNQRERQTIDNKLDNKFYSVLIIFSNDKSEMQLMVEKKKEIERPKLEWFRNEISEN